MANPHRQAGPRRRLLRACSWMLIAVALVLVVAIGVSTRWLVEYGGHGFGGRAYWLRLEKQSVLIGWWDPTDRRTKGKVDGWYADAAGGGWGWVPRWMLAPPNKGIFVPLWIPLTVVGVAGAGTWWRSRRHRRGLCPECGYDLSAIPGVAGSRVCPECGNSESR